VGKNKMVDEIIIAWWNLKSWSKNSTSHRWKRKNNNKHKKCQKNHHGVDKLEKNSTIKKLEEPLMKRNGETTLKKEENQWKMSSANEVRWKESSKLEVHWMPDLSWTLALIPIVKWA
jgi:hypothetical protein